MLCKYYKSVNGLVLTYTTKVLRRCLWRPITNKMIKNNQSKQFLNFRRGRISERNELRKQLRIRNNLEKRFYKKLNSLFRKFINVELYLYKEFGMSEPTIAAQRLNQEFLPLMFSHYRRVFSTIYISNEDSYEMNKKADQEAFVFGRSIDFESLVTTYFASRQLVLSGVSQRLANRISATIELGRADNLTLPQIAKLVSDKYLPISRSRAALISRTETHNAASFANNTYHQTIEKETGIKMMKKWVSTSDGRTRPSHASANGQIVAMSEDFIVGGFPMEYAGDFKGGAANVVNCRCVIVYGDENDIIS